MPLSKMERVIRIRDNQCPECHVSDSIIKGRNKKSARCSKCGCVFNEKGYVVATKTVEEHNLNERVERLEKLMSDFMDNKSRTYGEGFYESDD